MVDAPTFFGYAKENNQGTEPSIFFSSSKESWWLVKISVGKNRIQFFNVYFSKEKSLAHDTSSKGSAS